MVTDLPLPDHGFASPHRPGTLLGVKSALLALTLQLSALAWIVALVVDSGPLEAVPALLVGVGLLSMSTVATVGMIVVGGRWSHRLGLVALAVGWIVAVIRPIDVWWIVAVVLGAAALVALLSPGLTRNIRKLPSASGPSPRAITPPLILLAAPCVLGFLGNDATVWAILIVGLAAPSVALLYSRVLPGGLLAIRLIWPLMAVAMAPAMGWWAGSASVLMGVTVGVLSWHRSVRASYHPPQEEGSMYPIPPELAPGEVLDAANIDDRGRPK